MPNERPKAILITGGRGFIGRHLVRHLAKSALETIVSVDAAPLIEVENVDPRRLTEIQLDILEKERLRDLFTRFDFSAIFDLASITEVGLTQEEYKNNIELTRVMTELVLEFHIPKYVFFSTQLVFRKEDALPRCNQDYFPIDAYSESKVQSERMTRAALPTERWIILRPSYIWGEGHTRFRDGFLYRLAKGQLLVPASDKLARYYGYVRTICQQAEKLAAIPFAELPQKTYYLSDPPISLTWFCGHLLAALGRGRARSVPPTLIRALGRIGDLAGGAGFPFPINGLQANEMTRNYPIPIEPTLAIAKTSTDYPRAAATVIAWALSDPGFKGRIGA
jgi:nucleoside-diphosphate-sugar epimerase